VGAPVSNRVSLQQLRTWLNWHSERSAHGDKRRANTLTKVDSTLTKLLRSGRTLREVELYQKIYAEKINACVKDEISDQGAVSASDKMRIRRKVVEQLWMEDKNKVEVKEAMEMAKARLTGPASAEEHKSEERIPEQYQK
jgi:hypothetical protein